MLASNSTAAATLSLANSDVSLLNYQSALYPSSAAPVAGVAQQSVSLQPGTTQICTQTDPFQQTFIVCPPAFQSKPRTFGVMLWFQSVKAVEVAIHTKVRKPWLWAELSVGVTQGSCIRWKCRTRSDMCRQLDSLPGPAGTRWQDLACLACSLQLVARPVFPPKLNTAAFHRKQGPEEPDLPENQCVCYLKSKYLVFEPQFTALMQVFAASRLSQAVGQWA